MPLTGLILISDLRTQENKGNYCHFFSSNSEKEDEHSLPMEEKREKLIFMPIPSSALRVGKAAMTQKDLNQNRKCNSAY